MTLDFRRPDGRDEELTRAMRELLAPPSAAGYWDGLEARIMARIAARGAADAEPWGVLAAWARPAMVAAAAAVLMASAALLHARRIEARGAYEALLAPALGAVTPVETAALLPPGSADRETTLRFLIAH
jgi:hypothetical protein